MNNRELIEKLQVFWYSWGEDANRERSEAAKEIIKLNTILEQNQEELRSLRLLLNSTLDIVAYCRKDY
jgi:hypothetical protein